MRIYYIDYAKALGMLLIIAAHTFMWTPVTYPVCYIACSFHVPIFFIISGLLLALFPRKEKFLSFVKKRAAVLLIPYVCFSIFNAIQTLSVLWFFDNLTDVRFHSEMVELLITGNGTVWFLVTLFLAELLFYIFKAMKSNVLLVSSAVILEMLAFIPGEVSNPFVIVINRAISAYGFIVVGYYSYRLVCQPKNTKIIIGCIMLVVWAGLLFYAPYSYSYFEGQFSNLVSSIVTIISASLGAILLLSCFRLYIPFWEYIGRNSLLFMLCHPTFIKIYIVIGTTRITNQSTFMQIIASICVFLIVILGTSIFGEVVKRCFPFIIGKYKQR